eukprot:6106135-Lingulodinium_polyedra.AAC.1
MPPLYWCKIPVMNAKTSAMEEQSLPFLLPHEVFATVLEKASGQVSCTPPEKHLKDLKDQVCQSLGMDPARSFPLGLHGDGVPHAKSKSIEVMSWNFLSAQTSDRFPFAVVEKAFCCNCGCSGRHTLERMLEVFC